MQTVLGVIGGSGLYDLQGLESREWRPVSGPWGAPSDEILFAEFEGLPLRFLPRHGRGHPMSPTGINYRANIDALKRSGVTDLISMSACGSLKESLAPGTIVFVDQFIDRTVSRERSFFGDGCVAHVSMADPVSPDLLKRLEAAARAEGVKATTGGTYVAIEGPQFSTRAESRMFQSWGCDVVGMTNLPEARLAREAELCYATVAMVTDYDCWREGPVSLAEILRVMAENLATAQKLLIRLIRDMPRIHPPCPIGSDTALDGAIITAPEARDPRLMAKLDAVARRILV